MNKILTIVNPVIVKADQRQPIAKVISRGLERLQEMRPAEMYRKHDSKTPHHKIYVINHGSIVARKIIPVIRKLKPEGVSLAYSEYNRNIQLNY
jgi:hypothetical protein